MYNPNERGIRNPNAQATVGATATGQGGLTYGQSAASGPAPTTAGHHRHDILNKLDPRVDSTHDRQPMSQTASSVPQGTYGPHSSRIANALDPRVDSDLDSTRAAGHGAGGGLAGPAHPAPRAAMHGAVGSGGGAAEGTYGLHSTRMGNALDPRVDSDGDRHVGPGATHAPGGAFGGGGDSSTTAAAGAGPWKSNTLNKLDPRVDSTTGA
ncbi:hypothetical protein N657DRAFT_650524 [Parathielavia appendiculata]|uniref:Uncharacterized protein n=1 Tax=Parathielavia appendiculata TaxID=2587402 RepID=A0AAN6TR50_9PEZI|nr:hypothetical protein N657DRAFT_650524 [Parathielavia appendiculata]